MHWLAQCHAKWPRRCRLFQHSWEIEPMSPDSLLLALTTKPSQFEKKNYIPLVVFRHLQPIFCVQDCCTQIFQVEYQGETRYTRIFERKPLKNTSYRILLRLKLKYVHFAQFLLNAPRAWPLICPLNLRLPSGTTFGKIARWPAGLQTWTQTWTLPPDQRVVKVYSLWTS